MVGWVLPLHSLSSKILKFLTPNSWIILLFTNSSKTHIFFSISSIFSTFFNGLFLTISLFASTFFYEAKHLLWLGQILSYNQVTGHQESSWFKPVLLTLLFVFQSLELLEHCCLILNPFHTFPVHVCLCIVKAYSVMVCNTGQRTCMKIHTLNTKSITCIRPNLLILMNPA